jgi:hypothetical protein
MIAFPLRRSVGLRAATASSRVTTLPMFVPHPLDDLTQLGTIGLNNEVDRQAVDGPCLDRPDDGHQCSSGRRLSLPAARAARPASSRPFPQPGPSPRLPSLSACLYAVGRHLPNFFTDETKIRRQNSMV